MTTRPDPPRAPRRPTELRHGDDVRVDDWYWLRNRDDPAVRAHLEAENAYTSAVLGHLAAVREVIFDEIKGRVQETDVSAPVRRGPFEYFTRTLEGAQYAIYCRRPAGGPPLAPGRPGSAPAEQVLLDENGLARPDEFFAVQSRAVSPSQHLLAYAVDRSGAERARLRFRDLDHDADLDDEVPDTYYGLAWVDDDTICYVRPDDAQRPYQVWRHRLGQPTGDDALVYEEADERFYVSIGRARSGGVVVIDTASKTTTEVWLVDVAAPERAPRVVAPRAEGVEYHVEHHRGPTGDRLYVVTNADGAENFQVMVTDAATPGREHWQVLVPGREDVRVDRVDAFAGHLVVSERAGGLPRVRALDLATGDAATLDTGDAVATTWLGPTPDYETTVLRLTVTSLALPMTDYDHDLSTGATTLVKRQPVAGYEPERFETSRLWATADDGTEVPISLIRRRGAPTDGTEPLLLYGYGAYEISIDPTFSISRLSLLERGVGYAVAHVRGGGELGRRWYEDGRLDHKRNTFTDFLACARHLVDLGHVAPDRLGCRGGSAGGLTVGAALNLAPEQWQAVVAEVPFVDCLTTMLDPSLPLTITEWDEWGNPVANERIYDYIKSYAPYDNVTGAPYPRILATAGVNDPRVQYWEPAKWVQRLRAATTGPEPTLLKVELGAGHHGRSGRYESWADEAFVLAFVLDALGAGQP